jgi:hypothetical protein
MDPARPKATRNVAIADHLWELFEEIARTMGSDRDALINQAMFMFARVNGFLDPSKASVSPGTKTNPAEQTPPHLGTPEFQGSAPIAHEPASASPARGIETHPAPHEAISLLPEHEAPSVPAQTAQSWGEHEALTSRPPPKSDEDSSHRKVAERVLQTAAELERMIKSRSEPQIPLPGADGFTHMENGAGSQSDERSGLFVVGEDGHEVRVAKERYLIGRGKHCDFVISSGKVSREHAAIVREGSDYYIEDLGSSNGTWFNKQRIKRRKIADGDEYFICSDKIRLVVR